NGEEVGIGKGSGGNGPAAGFLIIGATDKELFDTLALGIAVISARDDEVDFFPGGLPNFGSDELVRNWVPAQPMRITMAVGIDFLFQSAHTDGNKRIGIRARGRNAVATVGAERGSGAQV